MEEGSREEVPKTGRIDDTVKGEDRRDEGGNDNTNVTQKEGGEVQRVTAERQAVEKGETRPLSVEPAAGEAGIDNA